MVKKYIDLTKWQEQIVSKVITLLTLSLGSYMILRNLNSMIQKFFISNNIPMEAQILLGIGLIIASYYVSKTVGNII